uniref:Expressed protein n=3 Tax=Oryza sativa subsp. japonica TaxID=39947 RepID=Q10AS6_ORYSJ|nr:expressed protein [Oryza sativa Japonica Group]
MAREVMAGVFVRRPHHTHPLRCGGLSLSFSPLSLRLRGLHGAARQRRRDGGLGRVLRGVGHRRGDGQGQGAGRQRRPLWRQQGQLIPPPLRTFSVVHSQFNSTFVGLSTNGRSCIGPMGNSTNQGLEIASPVILVDGYNVCGYWGKLKKDFMNGRQEIARQMLIDELVSFSAVREIKVVVVFDAAASGLSTHKETYKGVDVVYSGDLSADSWIEKEVEALVADGCPKVWVVTSDALEQQLAHGEGALIWSSKRLVKEIKESEKELDEELKETRSTSLQGKLFQHKLKPKVVHALKDLRNKLEEEERRKR